MRTACAFDIERLVTHCAREHTSLHVGTTFLDPVDRAVGVALAESAVPGHER
jgi:hypothetical protein